MINKKVSTIAGSLIILAIAIALGFIFFSNKEKDIQDQNNVGLNNSELGNKEDVKKNYPRPDRSKYDQPSMPVLEDEANKSPKQLVNDFYDWYIKSNNYWHYQIYGSDHKPVDKPINLNALTQNSVFVSSSYKQNIANRATNGDPVLCTQDTNYNVVKNYDEVQISDNNARVDVARGYQDISDVVKIQVMLKKENSQWKIDDIICTNLIK